MAESGSGSSSRSGTNETTEQQAPGPGTGNEEADRSGSGHLPFSLPPIKLPPLFPETLEIRLPVPGYRTARTVSVGWTLVTILGFDVADALLAVSATGPVGLVRSIGGLLLAGMIAGPAGAIYLWEVLAVVVGAGTFTAFPTLLVVGILGMIRENRAQAERDT